jgi:hypothetical protein
MDPGGDGAPGLDALRELNDLNHSGETRECAGETGRLAHARGGRSDEDRKRPDRRESLQKRQLEPGLDLHPFLGRQRVERVRTGGAVHGPVVRLLVVQEGL